jgi:hypothetical protein
MPRKKSTAFYRNLLSHAWNMTKERKILWIFGLFAAIMSTGGVLDVVLRNFGKNPDNVGLFQEILDGSFIGYDFLVQYLAQVRFLGPERASITLALMIFLLFCILITSVLSQSALVKGLISRKSLSFRNAIKKGRTSFWHVLGIDLLAKITTFLLVTLTSLTFILATTQMNAATILLHIFLFLLFVPAVIIVNIIASLAVVESVEHNVHALDAIHNAWKVFSRHTLVTFELGLILFIIIFIAGLVGITFLIFLSIPLTLLSVLTLLTGAPILFILVKVVSVMIYLFLFFTFAGAAVTFQYAAWVRFWDMSRKKTHVRKIIPKLHRLWWD